jgi:hypothetical protein
MRIKHRASVLTYQLSFSYKQGVTGSSPVLQSSQGGPLRISTGMRQNVTCAKISVTSESLRLTLLRSAADAANVGYEALDEPGAKP